MNLRVEMPQRSCMNQERLAALVLENAADFAIITIDLDGVIMSWNGPAEHIMGWSASEAIGRTACMIFTPEDEAAGACTREMTVARADGRATDERWHLRKDGTRVWGSGTMTRLQDEKTGEHLGYAKIVRDRTEQHEAGERLKASEALLRNVFENSADCLKLLTPDGRLSFMNGPGLRMLGVDNPEDVQGRDWTSFWPGEVEGRLREAVAEAAAGRVGRFQGCCLTVQGVPKWWDVQVTPILGSQGQLERFLVSSRNVTEHHAAQEALRLSEERLRGAFEIKTVGVLFWGPKFTITEVNEAFLRMSEFSYEEAIGKTWQKLTPPEFHPVSRRAIEQVTTLGEATPYEKQYYRKDGSRWWGLFAPRRLKGEVVEFVLDISDRKAAEAALHKLNASLEAQVGERTRELLAREEQLRQSQKMEAIGQLTGGLAHDFNNLLTGIAGSLELLHARVQQGRINELGRYVDTAQDAAKRAAALTHRLLAFSRRQTLDPKPIDVNRLMAGMEELIRRMTGPAIAVEIVAASELWNTLVDSSQLENALLNLCINARDAMPNCGRLTIETGNKWLDPRAAGERELSAGPYVTLSVSDNGTGMTPDVIARAFDPFFTTKPIGQGTGLGLSMIYGFVRQSGGQIRIYSEFGQGTMVCLYLPRHYGVTEEAGQPAELSGAPRAEHGETVLVVDDEPTVRILATEVLEDLGYTVIEAAEGAAGLQVLQSGARIDLLVTDVGLPGGMNGRQLAEAARVARPGLKVLFITGFAENAVLSHGHLKPGMHVLTKPFAMEAFATRIKEMINDQQPVSA